MRNIKTIYILIILSALTLGSNAFTPSYPNFQAEERNKAIELFHNGKFAEALPIFKKLSDSYPSDYLLKYFTGACLIETGVYTKESEMNLLLAGTRDVPAKVFYYLARFYHAKDDWDSAVRFYNRFKNNSQPGQVAELRIDELIKLAFDHTNPFIEAGFQIPEKKEPLQPETSSISQQPIVIEPPANMEIPKEVVVKPDEITDKSKIEQIVTVSEPEQQPESIEIPVEETVQDSTSDIPAIESQPITTTPPPSVAKINFIRFQVNSQVTYLTEDLFQVSEARDAWKTGTEKEIELNGLLSTLTDLRNRYQHTGNPDQRDELARQIIDLERQTLVLRAETNQLFQQARQLEQQWWADADYTTYERFSQVSDSLLRLEETLRVASLPPPPVIDNSLIQENLDLNEEEAEETPDQDGLSYKVQLGSFTRAVPARTQTLFDKIGRIRPIETFVNEEGATVYTTGNMKTYADGLALQNQVRVEGVKDAFVIAIKDGKRIPLPEAKKLTGEE
jgi:tetratricopeptide (TPR) repeat protein